MKSPLIKPSHVEQSVTQRKAKPKRSYRGRFSGRETEIVDAVCSELETGKSLSQICSQNADFPERNTLWEWGEKSVEIAARFARARSVGFDAIADQALAIADDRKQDYGEDGYEQEHVARAKLRVETRLKLLAKWDPKRYGDAPAQTVVQVGVSVHAVSSEELERIATLKADARRLLKERS